MPMSADVSQDVLRYYFTAEAVSARPSSWFVGLHTANPGRTGANEVTTGDDAAYVRKAATFDVADAGSDGIFEATNDADVVYDPAGVGASYTVTHISIWTAATGGVLLGTLELAVPVPTVEGTINNFAIGDIIIRGV